jgi:hypothetical protein
VGCGTYTFVDLKLKLKRYLGLGPACLPLHAEMQRCRDAEMQRCREKNRGDGVMANQEIRRERDASTQAGNMMTEQVVSVIPSSQLPCLRMPNVYISMAKPCFLLITPDGRGRKMSSRTVVVGESDSLHAKLVCELVYHISNIVGGDLINHARTK